MTPRLISNLAAALIGLAPVEAVAQPITDAAVRAFVAGQEAAWNRRDLTAYFGGFSKDAVFVEQARTPAGGTIRYGSSDLAQARKQSMTFLARTRSVERSSVTRVAIAADGRGASVATRKSTTLSREGRTRTACAETLQILRLDGPRLRSLGQTETAVRCPPRR
ncbi:MAG: nuclear transport factor 2 family protein [Phenylobacterium sp.]|uniref:nuclear transport factor 2 family protein n=1 Tax=Phenylobacterium sp. TaxID=1871053 RepID=UPI002734B131|nr:nuclear transport factor 2 family protein [Phenylobacterium sp.]MDP3173558.1 nuclear transport factor 2 family protein [Phenylobacterium sp.]